jgi:hypothetical protein
VGERERSTRVTELLRVLSVATLTEPPTHLGVANGQCGIQAAWRGELLLLELGHKSVVEADAGEANLHVIDGGYDGSLDELLEPYMFRHGTTSHSATQIRTI